MADYRGLKHKQLEELRKLLKKAEGEFVVAKNRLFKRALSDKAKDFEAYLADTTAILFNFADEIAPLKELLKFFKIAGFGRAKAGVFGGQLFGEVDVVRLASLPTRQALLDQLVGQLNAPIQGLHYALSWNIQRLAYAIHAIKQIKN